MRDENDILFFKSFKEACNMLIESESDFRSVKCIVSSVVTFLPIKDFPLTF